MLRPDDIRDAYKAAIKLMMYYKMAQLMYMLLNQKSQNVWFQR